MDPTMTDTESTMHAADLVTDQPQLRGVPLIDVEHLDPIVRQRLQSKIDRLGYLGAFFQLTAHQPEALAAFVDYTDATKKALTDDLAEVVALTVATATGNDYERHQHERLSVKPGLTKEWVANVERLTPDSTGLTPPQPPAGPPILGAGRTARPRP